MKAILITLLIVLGGCKTGYYTFGDSLTAHIEPSCSWASQNNQLRADHPNVSLPYFQWMAQPGMTIMDFQLPTWIKPKNQITGLLFVLGANDVMYGIPEVEYRAKMTQIVTQAHSQGFTAVECVVIEQIPADLEGICDVIYTVPLFLDDSPDGLHMGCEGSKSFGLDIMGKL